ncbi:MAG: metallophosphoesterase [Deltaproteobacteria bacterium]|nr:metallophosphoesterase [Deltaproteobacteria bacterium]
MSTIRRLLPFLVASFACSVACSSPATDDTESSDGALSAPGANDLPWEVRSRRGETYLPNVFYAEPSETQQIMPLTIDGRHQIERLVYPTIGNPNLYVKADAGDEMMMVLRVENEVLRDIGATIGARVEGSSYLRQLDLGGDEGSGLRFFAVKRAGRTKGESPTAIEPDANVIELRPSAIHAHPAEGVPDAFKSRTTLRVVFDQAAMRDVEAGLYDLRVEVRREGRLAEVTRSVNKALYEVQYNALRVFDRLPSGPDGYTLINVTDTQVSHSEPGRGPARQTQFEVKTLAKLKEFVQQVNTSTDAAVRDAAFITFNGDLHNGGSPEALRPSRVAWTYNDEANAILDTIKELRFPIFLTVGNHDGYVATGQVPAAIDRGLGSALDWITGSQDGSLEQTVKAAEPKEWPGFSWDDYARFLAETKENAMGGRHLDVFTGSFRRVRNQQTMAKGWIPVPASKRNYILYDGFNQWQRTYGPTYASWTFGKNRFVNLNTYELRQHRRSGWGMYTVNYGGGVSQVQAEWLEKELARAEKDSDDVTILAHHDPRGGHNGKDYPYYFKQIDYRGMDESAKNYVQGEVLNPKICEHVPSWAMGRDQKLSCLHDGLQEWMRPDPEFDCDEEDRLPNDPDGRCDVQRFRTQRDAHPWYSGYAILAKLHQRSAVRTMILGHTHYNSVEMFESGTPLVPDRVVLDAKSLAAREAENPFRAKALGLTPETAETSSEHQGIVKEGENLVVDLEAAGHSVFDPRRGMDRLQGTGRELAILRLTSNSDLSGQTYRGKAMYGFSVLRLTTRADARRYGHPQINAVRFFLNDGGSASLVSELTLDRTKTVANAQVDASNPICGLFRGAGAEACQ